MIATYIQELLETNNRVIIPDFGAFLVRATSKNKDKKDLALKLEDIYFSPFLKFNDELLSKYIIEKENVSKDVAIKKINDFISLIKKDLDIDKPFIIKDFGKFIIDKQGKVQFLTVAKEKVKAKKEEPKTIKETPKTTKTTEKPKKTKTDTVKPAQTINDGKTVEKKTITKDSDKVEAIKETSATKETTISKPKPSQKPIYTQQQKKSINKGLVWAIAIGVPVAAIFIWAILNLDTVNELFKKEKKVENKEKIAIKKLKTKIPTIDAKKNDSLKGVEKTKINKQENNSKVITKKTNYKKTTAKASGKYYVIAGSFKNESFAEKFAEKLNKQGYNTEKITRPNGMFAISYSSFKDKRKASAEINYLTKEKNVKAWMLYY